MNLLAPTKPKDRFDVYRFFNGLSSEAKVGLDSRRLRTPLVKTFLLEHVSKHNGYSPKSPANIFKELGANIHILDERFIELTFTEEHPESSFSPKQVTPGYIEQYDDRFFAYYTCEDSDSAKKRVRRWTQSPDLDFAWFSGPLLQELWNKDVSKRGDNRFTRLKFKYENIFDMPEDSCEDNSPLDETEINDIEEEVLSSEYTDVERDDNIDHERRKASFTMSDRIGKIRLALKNLQENYAPLYALNALRFPSRDCRGGQELFQTGQVTNRTDSFEEHRNFVRYLYRIYNSILIKTEENAWPAIDKNERLQTGLKGVPLIIRFDEELSESVFKHWTHKAFQKRNFFKLWGNPIRLGPKKVHVYGADRHLWQPINLELTSNGLVAILPRGTCGNTFHRLITNVQQYISPKIKAWVGSIPFEELVSQWSCDAEQEDAN